MIDCSKCIPNSFYMTRCGYKAEYIGKTTSIDKKDCYVFYIAKFIPHFFEYYKDGSYGVMSDSSVDIVKEWKEPLKVGDKVVRSEKINGVIIGEVLKVNITGIYNTVVLWTNTNGTQFANHHNEDELELIK